MYDAFNGLERIDFLKTLDTLEKYILDVDTLRNGTLELFVNCGFEVYFSTMIVNCHARKINKGYTDIMRKGDNFNIEIETFGGMWEKWRLEDLEVFVGLKIYNLQVQAILITNKNKMEFYKLLKRLNPENIDFCGYEWKMAFMVDRSDFIHLEDLNIKRLGTWYCNRWPIKSTLTLLEKMLPWPEIRKIKKLRELVFGVKGFISKRKLFEFDIYGVQIGKGVTYYGAASTLIERLIDCKCMEYMCPNAFGDDVVRLKSNRTLKFFIKPR